MEDELPLPGSRGAYNIDFDNLEDMNPFQSNTKLGSSPPTTDNAINPFQSRNKLRSSPPLNDCNENQIKTESEALVNENSEMDNGESSKENESSNSKGTKNLHSPDEGSEVNPESMEMSDSSPQKESPKKAPRYCRVFVFIKDFLNNTSETESFLSICVYCKL